MSLKKQLIDKIKGYAGATMTYEEVVRFCQIFGHRASNGERRLREASAERNRQIKLGVPTEGIEIIYKEKDLYNKKTYIIGYRWHQAIRIITEYKDRVKKPQGRLF